MSKTAEFMKTPIQVVLEGGKRYAWCACGLSKSQPFCDGSHKSTPHTPLHYQATETETRWLCACKQTQRPPFCDGAHKQLQVHPQESLPRRVGTDGGG